MRSTQQSILAELFEHPPTSRRQLIPDRCSPQQFTRLSHANIAAELYASAESERRGGYRPMKIKEVIHSMSIVIEIKRERRCQHNNEFHRCLVHVRLWRAHKPILAYAERTRKYKYLLYLTAPLRKYAFNPKDTLKRSIMRRVFNRLRGKRSYNIAEVAYVGNYLDEARMLNDIADWITNPRDIIIDNPLKELEFDTIDQNRVPCNESQYEAIRDIGRRKIVLIQGPPGTGKSTTISNGILYRLPEEQRALVLSERNQAIDAVVEKLHACNIDMVVLGRVDMMPSAAAYHIDALINKRLERVLAVYNRVKKFKSREELDEHALNMPDIYQDMDAPNLRNALEEEYYDPMMQKYETDEAHVAFICAWDAWIGWARKSMAERIMHESRVVLCTMATAHTPRIKELDYYSIYIDEAATVREESMGIISHLMPTTLVLVGDHKQLGPFTNLNINLVNGEGRVMRSFFERCVACYLPYTMLRENYRNPICLVERLNRVVYDGNLIPMSGINGCIQWHEHKSSEDGRTKKDSSYEVTSRRNTGEANILVREYRRLKQQYPNREIMVTSFYQGQVKLLQRLLKPYKRPQDRIVTIDSSQGSETDIMLISCVRNGRSIGFCKVLNRFNVAISRPRHELHMFIHKPTFIRNPMWRAFVKNN